MLALLIEKNTMRYSLFVSLIVVSALVCMLCLTWSGPSETHPFTYHMDEWHQFMSVRALVTQGTSNVEGAANGPVAAFILSALWLAPWAALHWTALNALAGPLDNLSLQSELFAWLRISTLVYAVCTLILAWEVQKQLGLFRRNAWTLVFWLFSPLWLMLTTYFKYDIALILASVGTVLTLLWMTHKPTLFRFLSVCAALGAAVSIKVTALPLIIILGVWSVRNLPRQQWVLYALNGAAVFVSVVAVFGFPDLVFLGKGEYIHFFYDNIVVVPSSSHLFQTGHSLWTYLAFMQFPYQFGYGLCLYLLVLIVLLITHSIQKRKLPRKLTASEWLVISGLFAFVISIVPLQLMMVGNRWLVLLPWIVWLGALLSQRIEYEIEETWLPPVLRWFTALCVVIQIVHGIFFISVRLETDVRNSTSLRIMQMDEGTPLGIEAIPIYQMLPDGVLFDYYRTQYAHTPAHFVYQIVDAHTPELPPYVLVTDSLSTSILPQSPKAHLVARLLDEGYRMQWQEQPSFILHRYIGSRQQFALSGLNAAPMDITLYAKHN